METAQESGVALLQLGATGLKPVVAQARAWDVAASLVVCFMNHCCGSGHPPVTCPQTDAVLAEPGMPFRFLEAQRRAAVPPLLL